MKKSANENRWADNVSLAEFIYAETVTTESSLNVEMEKTLSFNI